MSAELYFKLTKIVIFIHFESSSYKLYTTSNLLKTVLKSDFNKVLFVLKVGELICKNIKITTICISKDNSTHKKYLNNNYFPLLLFGFIRMKMNTTLILAKHFAVIQYSLSRKLHQRALLWQKLNVP